MLKERYVTFISDLLILNNFLDVGHTKQSASDPTHTTEEVSA